ncbi:hypothetical protein NL676_001752 [Syzygium grande]|nr:hypothetical protein NL676_001752 [Syzygium grande]
MWILFDRENTIHIQPHVVIVTIFCIALLGVKFYSYNLVLRESGCARVDYTEPSSISAVWKTRFSSYNEGKTFTTQNGPLSYTENKGGILRCSDSTVPPFLP